MLTINCRLAELWNMHKTAGSLSEDEQDEMNMFLTANMNYVMKMSQLEELSYQASCTNDIEWQHDICREIEELQYKHELKFVTRPTRNRSGNDQESN